MPNVLRLALAVCASSTLYAAALWLAPTATLFVLLAPLPGIFVGARRSVAECGVWLFLTAAAIAAAVGPDAVPGFILPLGLPALAITVGARRWWPFERLALAGLAAWCVGVCTLLLLAFGDLGAVVALARQQLTHSVDLALSTYGSFGASDTPALAQAEREMLINGLLEILPALTVLTGGLTILLNLLLLRRFSDRSWDVDLRLWRTPDSLIWAFIGAGFGIFVPQLVVAVVAKNVFIVVVGGYFCQGLAIVSYYLERFRLPRGIRVAGYVLIAVQHVIALMVIALGVFDLWGDFRRLSTGPADVSFHTDE